MIPLVSRGGEGLCKQRSVYHWAGTKCLVIDVFTTLSGFSLTDGMTVHSRRVYRERGGAVHYEVSAAIIFQDNSSINILLRTPALANVKSHHVELFQLIRKLQKGKRSVLLDSPKKKPIVVLEKEEDEKQVKIEELRKENESLRKLMRNWGIVLLCLYVVTVLLLMI